MFAPLRALCPCPPRMPGNLCKKYKFYTDLAFVEKYLQLRSESMIVFFYFDFAPTIVYSLAVSFAHTL